MREPCEFNVSEILTKRENRLRKWWSYSLIGVPLIPCFAVILWFILMVIGNPMALLGVFLVIQYILIMIVAQFLPFALLYEFTYRRCGTRCLTLVLCITTIGILIGIPSSARIVFNNPWELAAFLICLALFSLWVSLGVKIRKINKKILRHIFENESHALHRFQNSDNLQTLKQAYEEEKKNWPQVSRWITREYKNRKKILSCEGSPCNGG